MDIERAFASTPRENFLPEEETAHAGWDTALPIGFGQTNSQPSTVRQMLEWLEVEPGNNVLDVGSGSGWTSALLSRLAGPKGHIFAVEIIPELVEFGRANCERLDVTNISFRRAGKELGLPEHAPYERILVSASGNELPEELKAQLAVGGKMVAPVGHDILEIEKTATDTYETLVHSGYVFVPLVMG